MFCSGPSGFRGTSRPPQTGRDAFGGQTGNFASPQPGGFGLNRGPPASQAASGHAGFEAFGADFSGHSGDADSLRSGFGGQSGAAPGQQGVLDNSQRGFGRQQDVLGSQQRGQRGQQGGFGGQQGGFSSQQGGFDGQQSGFSGQQAGFNGQQGGFGGQQGGFGGQQGGFGGQQGGFGGQQSGFSGQQGGFNSQQERFGRQQEKFGDKQAGGFGASQADQENRPGAPSSQQLSFDRFQNQVHPAAGFQQQQVGAAAGYQQQYQQNHGAAAGYQQQLAAAASYQQHQQRGGRGVVPPFHPNAILPFTKPAFGEETETGQGQKNKREFADRPQGFSNNLNFQAGDDSQNGSNFFDGQKPAANQGSSAAFNRLHGGPGLLPFAGQSYQQINFPLRAGQGGDGGRFTGQELPHPSQQLGFAQPSRPFPPAAGPFSGGQGPFQGGKDPFQGGQGRFGPSPPLNGLAVGIQGPASPANSNLVEGNPFATDDQLELEKVGGAPAASSPGRPFLPFLNGKKLNRGEGASGPPQSSTQLSGDFSDFSNFGPDSGGSLQDFGGPEYEVNEQDDEGENEFLRPSEGEAAFFSGAGGPLDFPTDDSSSDGRFNLEASGSRGNIGRGNNQKNPAATLAEYNDRGESSGFAVGEGNGFRGSRGTGVQGRPPGFGHPNAGGGNGAGSGVRSSVNADTKVRQNFDSRPGQRQQVNSDSNAGISDYKINSFEEFDGRGSSNKNNQQDFDREYDFGMSDGKGFDDEFPNSDESNFFAKTGATEPVGRPSWAGQASFNQPASKTKNSKQKSSLKFPRNRRNFIPSSGKVKINEKMDERDTTEAAEDDVDGFEILTESSSKV